MRAADSPPTGSATGIQLLRPNWNGLLLEP
jgi:hypothetical protein